MPVVSNLVHLISRALRYLWRWGFMRETKEAHNLREILESLTDLHQHIHHLKEGQEKIMAELQDAQAALAKLGADVDALIAKPSTGIAPADVQTLTDGMNAIDAKVVAATTP